MEECSGRPARNDWRIPAYRQPVRVWAGNGTGAPCSFCGCCIQPHELEYEIELSPPTERILRFHFRCYRSWEAQNTHVAQP
jgi:hypothetical protein